MSLEPGIKFPQLKENEHILALFDDGTVYSYVIGSYNRHQIHIRNFHTEYNEEIIHRTEFISQIVMSPDKILHIIDKIPHITDNSRSFGFGYQKYNIFLTTLTSIPHNFEINWWTVHLIVGETRSYIYKVPYHELIDTTTGNTFAVLIVPPNKVGYRNKITIYIDKDSNIIYLGEDNQIHLLNSQGQEIYHEIYMDHPKLLIKDNIIVIADHYTVTTRTLYKHRVISNIYSASEQILGLYPTQSPDHICHVIQKNGTELLRVRLRSETIAKAVWIILYWLRHAYYRPPDGPGYLKILS